MALLILDSLDAAALEADATFRFKDGSDAAAMEVEARRCDNPEADCNANNVTFLGNVDCPELKS